MKHAAKHQKAIDLDVKITKDGVPVNTHWADVLERGGFFDPKGKTPKNARISELKAKEVFRLRSKDGYRIHSLRRHEEDLRCRTHPDLHEDHLHHARGDESPEGGHRAGLTTVLLPRGPVPKSGRPYIDYVRGPVK